MKCRVPFPDELDTDDGIALNKVIQDRKDAEAIAFEEYEEEIRLGKRKLTRDSVGLG